MPDRPTASLSTNGAAGIRPLDEGDRDLLKALYRHGDNALLTGRLEIEAPDFIAAVRSEPWSTPMVLMNEGDAIAVAMTVAADTQHRHGRLAILARDPGRAQPAMALFLRHAFWSHPLHRLYILIPTRISPGLGYTELLQGTGFVAEGRLTSHFRTGPRLRDLDVFGLLRPEFDAWCRQRMPELVLP